MKISFKRWGTQPIDEDNVVDMRRELKVFGLCSPTQRAICTRAQTCMIAKEYAGIYKNKKKIPPSVYYGMCKHYKTTIEVEEIGHETPDRKTPRNDDSGGQDEG